MSINLTIKYKDREIVLTADQGNTVRWIKQQLETQTKIPFLQQ